MKMTYTWVFALLSALVACGGDGSGDTNPSSNGSGSSNGNGNGGSGSTRPTRLTPSLDINVCSVFSSTDIAELGFTEDRRGGSVVGFLSPTSRELKPTCDFSFGAANYLDVEIGRPETYLAGSDTAEVGEAAHFSSNIVGDPELVFLNNGRVYTLTTDGVGNMTTDRTSLIDYAERIIANEDNQTGLFDDLDTAERVGGPAVLPCDLIDAEDVAANAGFDTYLVYPVQGGVVDGVDCHVQGDDFDNLEIVAFREDATTCSGEGTAFEIEGLSACADANPVGFGRQLVVDLTGYYLVVSSLQDTAPDAVDARLQALAVSVLVQLP